jgi:hypothetical protein
MRSESEIRALIDGPIPIELQSIIDEYDKWQQAHMLAEQDAFHVDTPLYQYTGLGALRGIIETETIWCTHYLCMNDPKELSHGIDIAHEVMNRIAHSKADRRLRIFRDVVCDLLVPKNFPNNIVFYTASFTAQRDDAGQWERYGEHRRGVAIGFSPSLFGIIDHVGLKPHEMSFVGPVYYDRKAIFDRHDKAMWAAATKFLRADRRLMADLENGLPFIDALAKHLIASPLIWNCITSKEQAKWESEREVRLILMGQPETLDPYLLHRWREDCDRVPYIPHPFKVRAPGALFEIVVGPDADVDAEANVQKILDEFGISEVRISHSELR